jgi:hypothetical protein
MIGDGYWAIGIEVTYHEGRTASENGRRYEVPWSAKAQFFDNGFCETGSTEGVLHTRYTVPTLSDAIDLVKADVESLGITWVSTCTIYMTEDGEDEEHPPPEGWRELLAAECERIGWRSAYVGVS